MINIEAFTTLIKGLKYNKTEDLFVFNKKQYKFRQSAKALNKKTPYIYYFINVNDVCDIKKVTVTKNGIPTYDDFNKVKINFKEIRTRYFHEYYLKRRTIEEQMIIDGRKFFKKKSQQLKALIKEDLNSEKETKYCVKCGQEFVPVRKSQKFCTTKCRIDHFLKIQTMKTLKKNKEIKECPVCQTKFEGNKREVYCSPKCKKEASKIRRKLKK